MFLDDKNHIKAGVTTLFLPIFGDVISRTMWYNCSIHKPWTLILSGIPGLHIIPSIMYFTNNITPGTESCGSLLDIFYLVIPIVCVLFGIVLNSIINSGENPTLYTIISLITFITFFTIIRVYKYYDKCEKIKKPEKKWISMILWALFYATVINISVVVLNFISSSEILRMIPVLGLLLRGWSLLDYIPGSNYAIILLIGHIISNMYENTPSYTDPFCGVEEKK
jgi:hypothetical protein